MITRSFAGTLSFLVFGAVLVGGSGGDPVRTGQGPEEREEQPRPHRRAIGGVKDARSGSPQSTAYAVSDTDTLASLLPGGEIVFSPLSVALWRDYLAADGSVSMPQPGTANVASVSGDAEGGFRVAYAIDGREFQSHFPASLFSADIFRGRAADNRLVPFSLWSWTDSFDVDPQGPAATDRTDGPSYYDYFDINGWQAGGALTGNFRGFMTYGVRTLPENLPPGRAAYAGILQAELWRADNWQWGSRTSLQGTIDLEVNFSTGSVTGRVHALRIRVRGAQGFQPLAEGNSVDIEATQIGNARVVAEWMTGEPDDTAVAGQTIRGFDGTLIGEFYGPSANEIGGVLSGRLAPTSASPEQFLIGSFGCSRRISGK